MSKKKASHQAGEATKKLLEAKSKLVRDDWRTQPLSGHLLVGLLEDFLARYVVLPSGLALVLALWIMGTHIFEAFDVFPYLCVTSPVKRSGKTRLAEILELLCPRVINSVNITEAALFRTVDESKPVLILDEAENLASRRSERTQSLLALLQAGFKKGARVPRIGRERAVEFFDVYCPKAVLGIGSFPDTLLDRSIHVLMQRKRPAQQVEQFRIRTAKEQAEAPRREVRLWRKAGLEAVASAYHSQRIEFVRDREADLWEPLFAVASVAVPNRLEELQRTALELSGEKAKLDAEETEGLRLLADIRCVFDTLEAEQIHTAHLIAELIGLPESMWHGLTPYRLARLLRTFGIFSRQIWLDETNRRGFERADFKLAFERYLPKS